ncbi:dolichyl-phosphate-mannose--protein mannosyltransferase [Rhodoluna limnophila]|uniref:dolichyl-phosphate-mannose--protein mannosyltransferase n=1 Tax=Rhodoluna limnophila TaxID=232537 RepID=UPI00110656F9|nr:phospholipid carrier-dependent glycosyltransferase [Rhodoluna limnophila]
MSAFERWAMLAIMGLAAVLRLWNLGYPAKLVFDETYYVKDAWSLWNTGAERSWPENANPAFEAGQVDTYLSEPSFVVHPPLGKWIIGFGMWLFGPENPASWRASVAIIGIAMVYLIYLVARILFRSKFWAIASAFLLAIDGHAIVLSRTALLDNILAFFVLLAFYAVLRDQQSRATNSIGWRRPWLIGAGLILGAAMAVKWSGLYFAVAFGLYLVVSEALERRKNQPVEWGSASAKQALRTFTLMAPGAALVYLVSWTGWILGTDGYQRQYAPTWFESLIAYHENAYGFHVGLVTPHSYASNPLTWLFGLRPTSFFYEGVNNGVGGCTAAENCSSAITALGNPFIWWPAALALFFVLVWFIKMRDRTAGLILLGILAGYVPWLFFMQRTTFQFYAIVFLPWMILALVYVIQIYLRDAGTVAGDKIRFWVAAYLVVVFAATIYFLPIWNGTLIPYNFWRGHMWLPSWI